MGPLTKIKISRVIPFGLIWMGFSIVYLLLERGLLGNLNYYPATGNPYHFSKSFLVTSITALITGLLIGTIEITYFNKLFLQMTFARKLIYKTIIYIGIIILFLLILTSVFNSMELHKSLFGKEVRDNISMFFFSYSFWGTEIYIASIILVSLFYTEVSQNLGQGVLSNFLAGKYHRPTEEERIFMFLDMKSSTSIAEKLGHIQYFELLKEYYADLTTPVIEYSGEIYQYVGDEMVVSWKLKNGLLNSNCIQCFFAMRSALNSQSDKYLEKFGVVPEFKAGFHAGKVITGEIGVVKKEIIFTGDVLNTSARIQGLCNQYRVDVLISRALTNKLSLPAGIEKKSLGESELRGREGRMELFTLTAAPDSN